jgi:hypothetical protein
MVSCIRMRLSNSYTVLIGAFFSSFCTVDYGAKLKDPNFLV